MAVGGTAGLGTVAALGYWLLMRNLPEVGESAAPAVPVVEAPVPAQVPAAQPASVVQAPTPERTPAATPAEL